MAELPATPEQPPEPPVPARPRCANCGAELLGPYCHQCGQSRRHVLKHLPALVEDGLDLVFNIDGRIMHTLPALYLRPGFLANEYFAGRRMRYIPPFRLMFFLSVLAFLVLQLSLNLPGNQFNVEIKPPPIHGDTPAQVRASFNQAEQQLLKARADPDLPAIARVALDASDRALRDSANQRLRQLGAPPLAAAAAPPGSTRLKDTAAGRHYLESIRQAPDVDTLEQRLASARSDILASLANPALAAAASTQLKSLRNQLDAAAAQRKAQLEHPATPAPAASSSPLHKVHIAWLPGFLNQRLNEGIERAQANVKAIETGTSKDRSEAFRRIRAETLSVLPQALFVMLPLFAVLLKIVYLFKRRLYIEHLMVAMYSHAFIYLSLLLLGVLGLLKAVSPAWLGNLLGLAVFAIFLWIPVYLLLMQKRVYAQGWPMTLLKYSFVGVCYTILVSLVIASATMIGLAS